MNKFNREEDRDYWDNFIQLKQTAVIVDIDGSLALFGTENPYDRDYSKDKCNIALRRIIKSIFDDGTQILGVSGRYEKFREITETWAHNNDIFFDKLFMRPNNDKRADDILKEEIYLRDIKPFYNILAAFDDRKRIKRMWHRNKVYVFDLNQTDEEF